MSIDEDTGQGDGNAQTLLLVHLLLKDEEAAQNDRTELEVAEDIVAAR